MHNSAFGNTGVPRVALTWQALRGGEIFSGTRLRFSYATGFKEPRLEETFNGFLPNPLIFANPGLKPERTRAFEAGCSRISSAGKIRFNATYFNNLFHDQINYVTVDPLTLWAILNVNKALAHGAEVGLQAKLRPRLLLNAAYTYTSTQIWTIRRPSMHLYNPGQPLLRRPKHSATALLSYLGIAVGSELGGSFVGRRPDSDFLVRHRSRGGIRAGRSWGWYAVQPRITDLCEHRERAWTGGTTRSWAIRRCR